MNVTSIHWQTWYTYHWRFTHVHTIYTLRTHCSTTTIHTSSFPVVQRTVKFCFLSVWGSWKWKCHCSEQKPWLCWRRYTASISHTQSSHTAGCLATFYGVWHVRKRKALRQISEVTLQEDKYKVQAGLTACNRQTAHTAMEYTKHTAG